MLTLVEVLVLETVKVRQLALLQNANDADAVGLESVKYDVVRVINPTEAWADVVARAADAVTFGEGC